MHGSSSNACAYAQDDVLLIVEQMLADLPDYCPVVDLPVPNPANAARAAETLALLKAPLLRRARPAETWAPVSRHLRERCPVPANDEAPASSPPLITLSKKAPARPRRSQARDRRNLVILEGFIRDARPATREPGAGPLVAAPPSPSRPPSSFSSPPKKLLTKREKAAAKDTRKAPAWRYTTEIARGHAAIRAVSTTGAGLAWSLNLGGKVLAAANDNPARELARFQDRLAKALKAEFGETRDVAFFAETTAAGRLHLHGAADANLNEAARISAVLTRCGGTWDKTHREKQTHVTDLWCGDGWVRYAEKDAARTRRTLGLRSILFMSRGCRSRAETLWEARRAA